MPWCNSGNLAEWFELPHSITHAAALLFEVLRVRFEFALCYREAVVRTLVLRCLGWAQGIAYLHGYAIVHGDLKPRNILLHTTHMGKKHSVVHPLIADWGLSRECLGVSTSKATTSRAFTKNYAAPEVEKGTRTSFASDMLVGLALHLFLQGH
mgnify:CR=1 FL=1